MWMPAHQGMAAIGERHLSNGKELSAVDWRANCLADARAKQVASLRKGPPAVLRFLKSGKAAVRHAAALLGQVTHAANNHRVLIVGADGVPHMKNIRDAQPRPLGVARRTRVTAPEASPTTQQGRSRFIAKDLTRVTAPETRKRQAARDSASRLAAKRRRILEVAQARRSVEDLAAHAMQPAEGPTATERQADVRQRVLARIAAESS